MPRWRLALIACFVATTAFAQGPARDRRPTATATGAGAIRGRVVTSDGLPARQAEVQLAAVEADRRRTTSTDPDGRFSFEGVAPGRYALIARKSPYLPFGYGQKEFPGRVEPITLGAGEELTGLDILLPRGSAITGRLTNEYGEPVFRATVSALKYGYTETGLRTLKAVPALPGPAPGPGSGLIGPISGSRVVTDDLGQFRLFGLEPGEYIVSAASSESGPGHAAAFAPTFYPGTMNPAEAAPIRLGLAEETTIQLQLVSARTARISGIVVDSRGRPGAYGLPITLRSQSAAFAGESRTVNMRDGGEFQVEDVPPGDYTLLVSPFPAGDAYPKQPGGPEFASMPVSVSGSDVTDLRLATRPVTTIAGRVVFEGVRPASLRTIDVQPVPVNALDAGVRFRFARNADDGVRDDGTFELAGIVGPVILEVSAPEAYMVKSITVGGVDVTDVPFDPTAHGGPVDARVVLTDKVTAVSGRIPFDGLDVVGTMVVIVADAVPAGASPARFVRAVSPDPEGRFAVRGLPPGRYTAALVGSIDNTAIFDPQVQDRVRQRGRSFSMREGERVTLDLPATAAW